SGTARRALAPVPRTPSRPPAHLRVHSPATQSKAPAAASSKSFGSLPLKGDDLWPSRSGSDAPLPLHSKRNTAKAMPRMPHLTVPWTKCPSQKRLQNQSIETAPRDQAIGRCWLARARRPHHRSRGAGIGGRRPLRCYAATDTRFFIAGGQRERRRAG